MNQAELLSDVRDAFDQLESAISSGDARRCQPYVTAALYEQVVGVIDDLGRRGHRRVHGSFEITGADLLALDTDGAAVQRAQVRIHATSSLAEIDQRNEIVVGSDQPMAWIQGVLAERPPASARWLLADLGEIAISGPVEGPAGQPIKPTDPTELETKERDSIEHAAAFVAAGLNFMTLRHRPLV